MASEEEGRSPGHPLEAIWLIVRDVVWRSCSPEHSGEAGGGAGRQWGGVTAFFAVLSRIRDDFRNMVAPSPNAGGSDVMSASPEVSKPRSRHRHIAEWSYGTKKSWG